MIRRDWVSAIDVNDFEDFLSKNLGLFPNLVEKRFNRYYGTYFVAYPLNENEEVIYFGNFGKLKVVKNKGKILFEDDLDYLSQNPAFQMEYLAFVHRHNKIDGQDKRLFDRTFIEDYKIKNKNKLKNDYEKGE